MEQKFGCRRAVIYIINIIVPLLIHLIIILSFLYVTISGSEYSVFRRVISIALAAYIFALDVRWIIMLAIITIDILTKNCDKRIVQIREIANDKKYANFAYNLFRRVNSDYSKNYTVRTRDCQIYRLRMRGRVSPIHDQISKAYDYKHHEIIYLKLSKFIIDIKPVKEAN
ncbi:MAG: hypothetical protein GX915_07160 [Clostridiales bacterium]|nr:hypothetical protein [Clostridiales bacterium]